MKSLIITLLIFTGILREYFHIEVKDYNVYSPVCPVTVESDSYVETSNALFVQEKLKPIALLIPEDIKCDGLLCPIPPIERELKRPDLDLSNVTIWAALMLETRLLLPEIIAYILGFCYGRWSSRRKAENDRDESPAGRKSEGPQSPSQTHDNMEEEAEISRRRSKKREEPRSAKKKKKQHHSEAQENQGPKSNGKMKAEEEKELKQLFHQFICQCLEGDS
ncbi:hypothetical protein XELAEV_18028576mg [Xenopus laevis]|uniref:Uncharacterized protein n=1 Tax=Xenopus laevis TaxID=8355 RepID=A0A974CQ14_XENLA|nr:hypothetical protein XELAEV_18028576mg [Xenopus laevis]